MKALTKIKTDCPSRKLYIHALRMTLGECNKYQNLVCRSIYKERESILHECLCFIEFIKQVEEKR